MRETLKEEEDEIEKIESISEREKKKKIINKKKRSLLEKVIENGIFSF